MFFGLLMFGCACFAIYAGRTSGRDAADMHREPVVFWFEVAITASLGLGIAFGSGDNKNGGK
jgi:hypothetical protein